MTELTPQTVVCQHKDILSSAVDDETVLLSIEKSKYYGMDSVSNRIWELLVEPIRICNLIATLSQEYDISKAECQNDAISFLTELHAENLIIITDE